MESEYSIKGIDIGNECSAFVEVLVGGPLCARENFKEILITCSFMTPAESRTSSMPNRVRCFNREALVEEIASQKWKLLKINCSQPFNRDIKFGLSFIKIHVDEPAKAKNNIESNNGTSKPTNKSLFGSFSLREDSPDSETESTTALFNRWKVSKNKEPSAISSVPRIPSPAVLKKPNDSLIAKKTAPKAATPSSKKHDSEERPTVIDRNRNSLLFGDDDDEESVHDKRKKKLEKLEKVIAADQERVTKETEKNKKSKKPESTRNESKPEQTPKKDKPLNLSHSEKEKPSKTPKSNKKADTPSTSGQRRPSSSPCVSDKPKKPKLDNVQYKPFNQLLNGVVLVISGIQNPDRADLRNKALALGAKYKGDWDNSSTHLICAFKNTPKYNQVKGKGKIVTRSWIEDCYSKKRKIPWRRYALDTAELTKPESEDEFLDESLKPNEESEPITNRKDSEDSDVVMTKYDETNHSQFISSGSDTEDEIQRVLAKKSPPKKSPQKKIAQTIDVFEVFTEEEDYVSKKKLGSTDKTTFFKNLKFFVSDELSATQKIKVERYIEAFNGVLITSIDEANYLIAENRIADVGEFKGETVTPLWILECNDAECLIPTKRYLVK
ncbi:DNA repair protein XRCC1 [Episyrphus balteatus]|uniref:DNA repair protein XRCC1 n=1 Tax=Episyrphus balteatus TaxID=286459 RepID=UPI0024865496|nr:DNA repair protein XRCC1 [Episyrphus balteatus]